MIVLFLYSKMGVENRESAKVEGGDYYHRRIASEGRGAKIENTLSQRPRNDKLTIARDDVPCGGVEGDRG